MSGQITCEYCGMALGTDMQNCPGCGAPNPHYAPAAASPPTQPAASRRPTTIEELRAFCAGKNMPLEKMRFFIGTDERSPRAFGIYRDGSDFVVYKNKSDGSRAIRYRGPDEAYAVNELYEKLREEHLRRSGGGTTTRQTSVRGSARHNVQNRKRSFSYLPIILIILGYLLFSALPKALGHRNDGYYMVGSDLFYRYGSSWFYDLGSDYADGWTQVDAFPYDDAETYFQGSSYDESWGSTNFKDSWVWDEYQSSSYSDSDYDSDSDSDWDSDYDSWDSGDTDWDSDW